MLAPAWEVLLAFLLGVALVRFCFFPPCSLLALFWCVLLDALRGCPSVSPCECCLLGAVGAGPKHCAVLWGVVVLVFVQFGFVGWPVGSMVFVRALGGGGLFVLCLSPFRVSGFCVCGCRCRLVSCPTGLLPPLVVLILSLCFFLFLLGGGVPSCFLVCFLCVPRRFLLAVAPTYTCRRGPSLRTPRRHRVELWGALGDARVRSLVDSG